MRYASRILAVLVMMSFVGAVHAKEAADTATLTGKITKVTAKTIILVDADKKNHTVRTDAKTKVTLDGKEATLAELKAGEDVVVTPNKGVAKSIEATSAAEAKDAK